MNTRTTVTVPSVRGRSVSLIAIIGMTSLYHTKIIDKTRLSMVTFLQNN